MAVVLAVIPKCRISARYSSLNGRFPPSASTLLPSGMRCVAAVELSVWLKAGTRPS
ncbi:MAG: hypothetical protein IPG04_29860 [Polyangiaceae bacterium]|nr:hypothetical protein [Polyangiaceae bacterium]